MLSENDEQLDTVLASCPGAELGVVGAGDSHEVRARTPEREVGPVLGPGSLRDEGTGVRPEVFAESRPVIELQLLGGGEG